MATENKIPLMRLVWTALVAFLLIGIAWGGVVVRQTEHAKKIESLDTKKVEKEVYAQHVIHQQQQYEQIIKGIDEVKEEVRKK